MKRKRVSEEEEAFRRVARCCESNRTSFWPCPHPLEFAVQYNTINEVRAIVEFGASCAAARPNEVKPYANALLEGAVDYTQLLAQAALRGELDIVKYLCELGASVVSDVPTDENAIHNAAWFDRRDVLEYLLDAGADVNTRNASNETALFVAVEENLPDLVRFLVARGVDVNVRSAFGKSAVSDCIYFRCWREVDNETIMDILLANGAEPTEEEARGILEHYPDVARRHRRRLVQLLCNQ